MMPTYDEYPSLRPRQLYPPKPPRNPFAPAKPQAYRVAVTRCRCCGSTKIHL